MSEEVVKNEEIEEMNDPSMELKMTVPAKKALASMTGWVRFLSIISFIGGGFCLLFGLIAILMSSAFSEQSPLLPAGSSTMMGIFYLLIGGFVIYSALLLWRAAAAANNAVLSGNDSELEGFMCNMKTYYKVNGIFFIAMVGLIILSCIIFVLVGFHR